MSVVTDKFAEIEKLDEMRRMGILSEKDFELQKKVLLNQATQSSEQNDIYVVPKYSFMEAYKRFWSRWLDWQGRSTRAEYWYAQLGLFLSAILIFFAIAFYMNENGIELVTNIIIIVLVVPMLTLTIRRIHDTGRSAKFLLWPIIALIVSLILLLIPPIGAFAMLLSGLISLGVNIAVCVFSLLPSQPHKNIYDPEF